MWHEQEILTITMTYPVPHKEYLDTVCTGGITRDGKWIRLYPISYRYLDRQQQFSKFTWLKLNVRKSLKDNRPESFQPQEESIEVVGHINHPGERRYWLDRMLSPSIEHLEEMNREEPYSVSMGLIEMEYQDFYWKEEIREWSSKHVDFMKQQQLIGPTRRPLEKMPYDLRLRFRCNGNPECTGHDMSIFSWEFNQTFRNWRDSGKYSEETDVLQVLKKSFEDRFGSSKNISYVSVGTLSHYPTWIIGDLHSVAQDIPAQPPLM